MPGNGEGGKGWWLKYPKHSWVYTLPETNIFAPEDGWLEDFLVSFWDGLFSGAMLVSARVILLICR